MATAGAGTSRRQTAAARQAAGGHAALPQNDPNATDLHAHGPVPGEVVRMAGPGALADDHHNGRTE